MRNYVQIIAKIRETPWLITPESLSVILEIVDKRLTDGKLTEEEVQFRLQEAGVSHSNMDGGAQASGGLGIIPICGPIFAKADMFTQLSGASSLETFQNDLTSMLENDLVNAILLNIDSPGGTSDLVQETGDMIKAGREKKPIYAIANTTAGSAAYWLMSQADAGYVTPSGSVGSIGAYTVHEDQSLADQQAGKRFTFIKAGEFKTEGNPHEPLTDAAKQYAQTRIDELYGKFVSAVAEGRKVSTDTVKEQFGSGRMLSSANALSAGMVDGIMSYDQLVTQLTTPKTASYGGFAASLPAEVKAVAGFDKGGRFISSFNLESAEWEHSEPGTGPTPRTNQTITDPGTGQPIIQPSGDPTRENPAIAGGWRRNLPTEPDVSASAFINHGERSEQVTEDELKELYQLFNANDDDSFVLAIKDMHTQMSSLQQATQVALEERKFATEFPAAYAEMQELKQRDRSNQAAEFAASMSTIKTPQQDGTFTDSKVGLSALAISAVTEAHTKFALGAGTLADFENAIKTVTEGGIVDYSEYGSDRTKETVEFSTATPEDAKNAKVLFSAKIAEIQEKDGLEFRAAIAEATKQYPDLAAAYAIAVPA